MKRALILGDSLTLSREKPEICLYEDTWPVLLKNNFEVHQVSIGGGTIKDLHRQLQYHLTFNPNYVFIQCGIVDCAPRALSYFELEIVKKFWITNKIVAPFVKRNNRFLRKTRNKTYTSPHLFSDYLTRIVKIVPTSEMYAIGIIPPNDDYELIVPGIGKRVSEYNAILKNKFGSKFITMDNMDRGGIMSDNIHLNKDGHLFVYKKILNSLEEC